MCAEITAPGNVRSGIWRWHNKSGEITDVVGYIAHFDDADGWLRLFYRAGDAISQRVVQLTNTTPNYGGLRWWFVCPVTGKRATALYLPTGGERWVSREGGGLTYLSCRESGRFRSLFRRVAARMGADEAAVRHALRA